MLAIGLMSGTSLDGVDSSLIETDGINYFKKLENFHLPYPVEFQTKLRSLLDFKLDWFQIEKELTNYHYNCLMELLKKADISQDKVLVIGFPGQTIYHNPKENITWQIGNPHLLAHLTGIDVVSDFRRRDVVKGGQGAPLVPIFHQCLVQNEKLPVAILNIGGIANITYISRDSLIAFDTGPGNALINDATMKYYNIPYDDQGIIAEQGKINYTLIDETLKKPFFRSLPPKSLDRNEIIIDDKLFSNLSSEDIVASLTYLTALSISKSLQFLPKIPNKIYLCGGGYKNATLINMLKTMLTKTTLLNIAELGLDANFIEAQAFGYLAVRCLKKLPSTFPSTTGISQERPSGILFPSS